MVAFWYEEGRKYGIELLEKKDYKGSKLILTSVSKLIIRETNSNDTGGFFKTPSLEIIHLSGSYLCTETASQPPQNQKHYLEVKGENISCWNFSQSPVGLRSPGSWIQEQNNRTWTHGLASFWRRRRVWASLQRRQIIGSNVLSLTEMPRLGSRLFYKIFEERNVLRFGGQDQTSPPRTTQIWG